MKKKHQGPTKLLQLGDKGNPSVENPILRLQPPPKTSKEELKILTCQWQNYLKEEKVKEEKVKEE